MSFWLISVPKSGDVMGDLQRATGSSAQSMTFNLPELKVGTLDQLMALSEDTQKMDQFVGGVAKKIEKTYYEMWKAEALEVQAAKERTAAAAGQKESSSSSSNQKEERAPDLKIGDQNKNAHDFVTSWQWNDIRYPRRSPLRLLAEQVMKDSSKSDEALKKQVAEYNEVRTAHTTIERRDQGTLLVRPVSQYLQKQPIETLNFTTLLLVVPRARKEEFESSYEHLETEAVKRDIEEAKKKAAESADRARKEAERKAAEAAAAPAASSSSAAPAKTEAQLAHDKERAEQKALEAANNAEARKLEAEMADPAVKAAKDAAAKQAEEDEKRKNKKLDFPAVVFRSATCLCDLAGEEFLLYSVLVLRQGAENYKNLCREKRYVVRPFKFDPEEDRLERERKQQLAVKKKSLWNYLIRWCTTTYTEVFTAWIHLKAIRLYVESVLRYGLPFNAQAALIEPGKGKDRQLRESLRVLYSRLAGNNANLTTALDPNEPDISGLGVDFYPYVYLPLMLGE